MVFHSAIGGKNGPTMQYTVGNATISNGVGSRISLSAYAPAAPPRARVVNLYNHQQSDSFNAYRKRQNVEVAMIVDYLYATAMNCMNQIGLGCLSTSVSIWTYQTLCSAQI